MAREKKPYYMQDESDSSPEEEGSGGESTAVESEGGSKKKEWHWRPKPKDSETKDQEQVKVNLKGLSEEERKARLGRVELDPNINYADWSTAGPGLESRANMDSDGMINIWVDLKKALPDLPKDYARPVKEWAVEPATTSEQCPPLNIVIFIVGSRGDVQPYLSLALHLIQSHGHRVRIATHPDFEDFVKEANGHLVGKKCRGMDLEGKLEYFSVGGSPKELMAFMVKNPGLLPGWESLTNGDIGSKRRMTAEMLQKFYESTHSPDLVTGRPFAADAIISNPPAFGHIHIAEALGLPLLMTFTMPWTPSTDFKHPLVNIKQTNAELGLTNYFTFALAEMLQWQGLGDVINIFRTGTLGLDPLTARNGPSLVERLKVPWTYCWSEGLIPKPDDWKENIDISGFYFLEGESSFKPDEELVKFLKAGEPPIYIGFGSVVVEDAAAMTQTIFEAVKKAGVRALVSAGWGGLGGTDVPDEVFILKGNIPHDWLFAEGRVAAVCHHGGAGTTAIGLRNGLPTIVVPFFGDQKFWGDMIHRARAGPEPIPQKKLSADNLSEAIKYAVSAPAKTAAQSMGEKIRQEKGEVQGVKSFHKHLPLKNMRCQVDRERIGMWWSDDLCLRLSGAVAGLLKEERGLDFAKLVPLRAKEYQSRWRAKDPITGGSTAILHAVVNQYTSVAQIFYDPPKGIVNTALWAPQGILDLVEGLFTGFDSIPERIGSSTRERGPIENIGQGFKEGGKGLFYGWWDGITGLAVEPIEGAKKEGALGFIKGAGRSYVNVTARPAAGILGVMALPMQGAWKSLRRKTAGQPQKALRKPREELSISSAKELTPDERKQLLATFDRLVKETDQRKAKLKRRAQLILRGDERAYDEDIGTDADDAKSKGKDGKVDVKEQEEILGNVEQMMGAPVLRGSDQSAKGGIQGEAEKQGAGGQDIANVPAEEKEEMTEAERRGYERAMAEVRRRQAAEKK